MQSNNRRARRIRTAMMAAGAWVLACAGQAIAASQARCAGANVFGQLGDGTSADSAYLVAPAGLSDVIAVAAGGSHTVALKSDGTVWAWGNRTFSQTGQAASGAMPQLTPVQVPGISTAVAVAAGQFHSLALLADGTVRAWGNGSRGQLGNGSTSVAVATPVNVTGLANVTAIAAGAQFSLARRADGTVWSWGDNVALELGVASPLFRTTAAPVSGLTNITHIAAGSFHGLARRNDGVVLSWGLNKSGQLGDGTTASHAAPAAIPNLAGVAAVAAGGAHSLALLNDGTLKAWGAGKHGQLGDENMQDRLSPVAVDGLGSIMMIAAGGRHSLAISADGGVFAWGADEAGQLCDGANADRSTPEQVAAAGSITAADGGAQATAVVIGAAAQCLADIVPGGAVDVDDLFAVINAWGSCGDPRECPADIMPVPGGDGVVDVNDLFAVVNAWGVCP